MRLAGAILDDRAAGRSLLVQIDGELGIGKSVFLSDLLGAVGAGGLGADRVLRAGRTARGPSGRFGRLRQLVDALLAPDGAVDWDEPVDVERLARRCIDRIGRERLVIAVDDADLLSHDEKSLLTALVAVPAAPRVALVLAHRRGRAVREVLTAARDRGVLHEHVTLGPLVDDSLSRLVAGLDARHDALVREASAGNPLFVRVLVDAFRRCPETHDTEEALRRSARSGSQVLLAAVAHDLDGMPETTRRVLESSAVMGAEAGAPESISGLSREEHAAGEEALRDRRLLPARRGEALHPVIRHAVLMHLDEGEHIELYRRAAGQSVGSRRERAERLAGLGEHLTRDETDDLVRIASAECESAPLAVARWLSAVPRDAETPDVRRVLGRALLRAGAAEDAVAALEAAAPRSESDERSALDPSSDALLARALLAVGRYDEAKRVLAPLRSADPDSLALPTVREAADASMLIDGAADGRLLRRLRGADIEIDRFASRVYEVFTLLTNGDTPRARTLFAEILPLWRGMSDASRPASVVPLLFAAWSAHVLERFDDCRRLSEHGIALSLRHGRADALAILYAARAFSMMHLGRLDEADRAAEAGADIAERNGPQGAAAVARSALVVSAHARSGAGMGDAQLRERYDALAAAELPQMTWWRRVALSARSRASAVLGEPESAPELMSETVDAMTPLRYSDAARTAERAGDGELAAHVLELARAVASEHGLRGQRAMIDVQAAETLLREGRVLDAKNLLLAAQPVFSELEMVMLQRHVLVLLARAEESLSERSALFASLTERELQVAELVAAGSKNREISARLVISRRTAENHVANVLRKLEIGNRQDLAALLADDSAP